ncbi:site-specific DNA-methyltransferase [Hippea sp. KM1]|uniref:site-specific DNA-methyltransferase n=1 Tax=Hippea sp. KM1 TaxID=944481 RepID=UPI00046D35E7|nr:site-specific DNA-methyltransferase [Hippea sp. KM1]
MSKYDCLTKEELIKIIERQEQELKNKKYGLVWDAEREPEQVVLDCKNHLPVLERVKEKEIKTDDSEDNILIEGDNYHALTVLNYTHKGKIDVIYIDPPYNTGKAKEWKYNDKYVDKNDSYRHSKWLNFMEKRLKLAKELLSKNGVIICSIGEDELANLVLLLNKIFNFVSEPLVWLSKSPLNQNKLTKTSAICHEYIIIAGNKEVESKNELIDLENTDNFIAKDKIKNYPLGIFLKKDISKYKILKEENKEIILIPPSEYTIGKYKQGSFKEHRFQKRIFQKGHGSEKYVNFYKKILKKNNLPESYLGVILNVKDRNNLGVKFVLGNFYFQSISRFLTLKVPSFLGQYQGGYPGFPTAKPVDLIKRLIKLYSSRNSIILDFFAGSGTTGEAVLKLNEEDGGNRRFILCNTNENNIFSNICYRRLKNLLSKKRAPDHESKKN